MLAGGVYSVGPGPSDSSTYTEHAKRQKARSGDTYWAKSQLCGRLRGLRGYVVEDAETIYLHFGSTDGLVERACRTLSLKSNEAKGVMTHPS